MADLISTWNSWYQRRQQDVQQAAQRIGTTHRIVASRIVGSVDAAGRRVGDAPTWVAWNASRPLVAVTGNYVDAAANLQRAAEQVGGIAPAITAGFPAAGANVGAGVEAYGQGLGGALEAALGGAGRGASDTLKGLAVPLVALLAIVGLAIALIVWAVGRSGAARISGAPHVHVAG